MTVSLLEVSQAVQARALALTAETAGYLVLAVIDAGGLSQCTTPSEMALLDSGEVRLGAATTLQQPAAAERALRALLGQLLALCSVAHPVLSEISRADRQGSLARELEAALIPVNRAAGRRTLARACRDAERAKRSGRLNEVPGLFVPLAEPPPAQAQTVVAASSAPASAPPKAKLPVVERRRQPRPGQPRSVNAATQQAAASGSPRIVEAPTAVDPSFAIVEHTVRIDQLRANAADSANAVHSAGAQSAVAASHAGAVSESAPSRGRGTVVDRRGEPRTTGRRFNDVRASMEQHSKTPFLGSVITEMREQPLEHDTQIDPEVMPVEPIVSPGGVQVAAPEPVRIEPPPPFPVCSTPPPPPFVANVEPVSPIESAPALIHTPPWQPNVAPLLHPVVRAAVPVATADEPAQERMLAQSVAESRAVPEESCDETSDVEMPDVGALVVGESNEGGEEAAEQAEPEHEPIASESESSPLEEAEGFFLLLDEAGSSKPPTVAGTEHTELVELTQSQNEQHAQGEPGEELAVEQVAGLGADHQFADENEPAPAPDEVLPSQSTIRAPLYSPRKTQLADLFAELEPANLEQDVARELQVMAGIEASAVSQTPPPVGFSELNESSPLASQGERDHAPGQVLARAKGVGLATLTGLGVALLLWRAPGAEPPVRASAHRAEATCTASIQVVDAPSDAEIRVRAPAPNARFSPLAAHGSVAVFPQLPCATSLEVMVRDRSDLDSSWVVIPIAAEELTARTEQAPLRVSARREDRIVP